MYLLFNGQCAYHGRCVPGKHNLVDGHIEGWHLVYKNDRFTLYAPDEGQPGGVEGVIEAMRVDPGGTGRRARLPRVVRRGRTARGAGQDR